MNRRKKIREKLAKKAKRANARKHPKNKPAYISKADREKLTEAEAHSEDSAQETTQNANQETASNP